MISELVIASKNRDKVAEMQQLVLGLGIASSVVTASTWPDVDETGSTLSENARLKAEAAALATGYPALADDTGLEVDALNGAPGVHTARYAGPGATYDQNVSKLLAELEGSEVRTARFRTAVVLLDPVTALTYSAEGVVEGVILSQRRGKGGFGYDPVFEVNGSTFAELRAEDKNRLSHRARALENLRDVIGSG